MCLAWDCIRRALVPHVEIAGKQAVSREVLGTRDAVLFFGPLNDPWALMTEACSHRVGLAEDVFLPSTAVMLPYPAGILLYSGLVYTHDITVLQLDGMSYGAVVAKLVHHVCAVSGCAAPVSEWLEVLSAANPAEEWLALNLAFGAWACSGGTRAHSAPQAMRTHLQAHASEARTWRNARLYTDVWRMAMTLGNVPGGALRPVGSELDATVGWIAERIEPCDGDE